MQILGYEVTVQKAAPPIVATVADNRGGWWPWIREAFAGAWQRNIEWTAETVLAHHAVYGCITLIANDIAKLRPKLVEQDADGIWTEVSGASPFLKPLRQPNPYQNRIQFVAGWMFSKLIHGNAYILKRRDARGMVSELYLLDPSRVQVLVSPDGAVFYQLQPDNLSSLQEPITIPAREIIHDRINCLFHPLVGTSPIFAAGQAANMGLHIEKNSSDFFGNGSNPSGILSVDTSLTPQKKQEHIAAWNATFGPGGRGGIALLEGGWKYQPMRMSAVDSQLIEQLKWSAETVCSTFHVPPFKLGIGQMPTYQNGEVLNQIYYADCLQSHIEQLELCLDEGLGLTEVPGKTMGVELDLDGLLRMDKASQIKALVEGVGGTIMVPNEARRALDLKPLPGGDSLWMQQQNYSLEALAARDRNDPFAKPGPPAQLPAVAEEEERGAEFWRKSLPPPPLLAAAPEEDADGVEWWAIVTEEIPA